MLPPLPKLPSSPPQASEGVAKYADMFSAMGTEPRLRIMQLLLSSHPEGLVVGEIQDELEIPNSTLSNRLDKLRTEDLVEVKRGRDFSSVHRQYRRVAGTSPVPIGRVLQSQQSSQTARHRANLQIGANHDNL